MKTKFFVKKEKSKVRLAGLVLLLFLVLLLLPAAQSKEEVELDSKSIWEICFLDVGQGDCTLIRSPSGRTILIDSGTDLSADALIAHLYAERIDQIDLLIFSHAHEDHIGGAFTLLRRFPVDQIWMGDYTLSGTLGQKIALLPNLSVRRVRSGDELLLERDSKLEVLAPECSEENGDNNDSLILMLTVGSRKLLFTGDAESEAEETLIAAYGDRLKSDLLKVAHHGAATSSESAFLQRVRPSVAVISVGRDNSYGHPSSEVLDRLEACGTLILRTDLQGTLRFFCDGKRLYLKNTT